MWELPITIEYKGRKLTIDRKKSVLSVVISIVDGVKEALKYTYFINDNPVACITEIKYTLRKHYFTKLNYDYNTSDFKDIVKEAIKEKKRQDKIRFNKSMENDNDDRKKLYELVS